AAHVDGRRKTHRAAGLGFPVHHGVHRHGRQGIWPAAAWQSRGRLPDGGGTPRPARATRRRPGSLTHYPPPPGGLTVFAAIRAIEYHLPERVLTNQQLAEAFPDWTVAKIAAKTGIEQRHLAGPEECASDLAVAAARRLFASGACRPEDIDYLLLCT